MRSSDGTKLKYQGSFLDDGDDWYQFRNGKFPFSICLFMIFLMLQVGEILLKYVMCASLVVFL